jgi:hypothetical protein
MENIQGATPIRFEASVVPPAQVLETATVASAAASFPAYGTYQRDTATQVQHEVAAPPVFHQADSGAVETPHYIEEQPSYPVSDSVSEAISEVIPHELFKGSEIEEPLDDRSSHEQRESLDSDEDLYSVTGFNI